MVQKQNKGMSRHHYYLVSSSCGTIPQDPQRELSSYIPWGTEKIKSCNRIPFHHPLIIIYIVTTEN